MLAVAHWDGDPLLLVLSGGQDLGRGLPPSRPVAGVSWCSSLMLVNIKFWRGFARFRSKPSSGARALKPGVDIQRGSPALYAVISSGSWLHPRSRQQPVCPAASSHPLLVLHQSNQRRRAPVVNLMRGWKGTAAEGDGQRDPKCCQLQFKQAQLSSCNISGCCEMVH